jgi:HEPN domain-containing protein
MNGGADSRSLAEAWANKAAGDLAAAELLIGHPELRWTAAFHAQQCIEKCLKAVLVKLDLAFPKSHDIRGLALLVPSTLGLTIDRRIAAELSESAVAGRYPGSEDPGAEITAELVAEARRVLDWVRTYLSGSAIP